jgi:hypothetical protein
MSFKSLVKAFIYILFIVNISWFVILNKPKSDGVRFVKESFKGSNADNLVVFNAIGKRSNLALVKHSRATSFVKGEWDCVVFMFAYEDTIPEDDETLIQLKDEYECSVPRMPGIMWGDFLQFMIPTFVDNYDYVALLLDDIFLPDKGDNKFDPSKLIQRMEANNITVMSPGIVGDSHNVLGTADANGWGNCIIETEMIETYVQFFTREAWECYYRMLHHSGKRGWCYDICLKQHCPAEKLGQDMTMRAYHVDRTLTSLPPDLVQGTVLESWVYEWYKPDQGYNSQYALAPCHRLGCYDMKVGMNPIGCRDQ